MALVTLPSSPAPMSASWSLGDPGGVQRGAIGGSAQRVNRLGARWRYAVSLPPMTPSDARIWAAALARGLRNGVSYKVSQPTTPTGSPGSIAIAGAGQTGDSIDVDGGTPGYVVKQGQWLNIATSPRSYLYQAAATVRLDSSGEGTIEIEPPLRAVPNDNDVLNLGVPVIEGLLDMPPEWAIDANLLVQGITFTIEEVR